MDPIIYKKTHKRIRELNAFTAPQGDPIGSLVCSSEAKNWRAVFDDEEVGDDGLSYGIAINRLLMLSPNRKVPAAFLPSSISSSDGRIHTYQYTAGSTDPRECLPQPGTTDYGDMDIIYKVDMSGEGHPDIFYRYALTAEMTIQYWYEAYHPLSSNLRFANGEGTLVHDNIDSSTGMYSRQLDVNIGHPVARVGNILTISDHKLDHTLSTNVSSTVTVPDISAWPARVEDADFGDSIYIPTLTVDTPMPGRSTGHVETIVASEVVFPSTAAVGSTVGVIKIGADSDIKPIGTSNSAGTTSTSSSRPYLIAAASNHVHSMRKLTFTNTNASSSTIEYNGSADKSYNFNDILKATLPAQPATTNDQLILISTSSSATAWKTADYAFPTESFNGSGSRITLGGTDSTLCTVSGLTAGYIYLVTVQLDVKVAAGVGSAAVGPVPTTHELLLTVGGITKKVNIPGPWAYDVSWTGTVSWIIKSTGTSASLVGSMPGNSASDVYVNIFGVQCKGMNVLRLR